MNDTTQKKRHIRDQVLAVNLTTGTVEREPVPEPWRRRYLGGKGIGARYLYERLDAGTDPLGPANLLAFVVGPLSGYLPGEQRYAVVTKSPLTGGFLDSYSGGGFAEALCGALADCLGVLVTGRADRPVRLVLEDGSGRIEPTDSWGADTVETAEGVEGAVACVGPAGEAGVRYATVAADGGEHHAGRGGAGAVMGAKRLKSVVARGRSPEPGPALDDLGERYRRAYADHDAGTWQAAGGTVESVDFANAVGALATDGWQRRSFEGIEGVGVEAASDAADGRESGIVPGDFRFETDDGDVVVRGAAPMSLGAGLGIDDIEAVADLAGVCDRLGIDVIDAASAVAWTMRATEVGLVECPVAFGDAEGAAALIEAVVTGEGRVARTAMPGLLPALARGVDAASERFGGAAFVPTVKSMALPSYDPRGSPGMALAYATSDRGACHRRARPVEREVLDGRWSVADRVRTVVGEQTIRSVLWSLIIDDFVGETMWENLGREFLGAVGRSYTTAELARVGERIWTLTRLFNAREGFDRSDDSLPATLARAADDGGRVDPAAFEVTLDAYYRARGWGPNGLPTRETVERLDLTAVVDDETPLDDPW
jgi:aldehyde:ferredoxin oxidoreductase